MRLRHLHTTLLALTSVAVCSIATVLAAIPAAAHADLVSSDPVDGAVLQSAPTAITLTFSDPLFADGVQMSLVTADGTVVPSEAPVVADASVSMKWPATAGPGSYEVGYRVVSADGHPVSGSVSFTVQGAETSDSATIAAPSSEAISTDEPSSDAPSSMEPSTETANGVNATNDSPPMSMLVLGVAILAAAAVAIAGAIAFRRRQP